MCLVVKGKVQVLKESERVIRSAEGFILILRVKKLGINELLKDFGIYG